MNDLLTKKKAIILLLLGFLVFSPTSAKVSLYLLNMPFICPELLFVLFIPFIRRYYEISIRSFDLIITFLAVFSLFFISIVFGDISPIEAIAVGRSYMYLFLFYIVFSKNNILSINELYLISIGSVIGWILSIYIDLKLFNIGDLLSSVSYGNIVCVIFFVAITLTKKRVVFPLCLIVSVSVLSGLRRVLFIIITTCFISYVYSLFDVKKHLTFLRHIFILIIVVAVISPVFLVFLENNTPDVYRRIVLKTTSSIESGIDNSEDNSRVEQHEFVVNNIFKYVLPNGFVSKDYENNPELGIYYDVSILGLFYTFGYLSVIFLFMFLRCSFILMKKYLKKGNVEYCIYGVSLLSLFFLLFIEGSFLTFPYSTPITGLCLGKAVFYSKH